MPVDELEKIIHVGTVGERQAKCVTSQVERNAYAAAHKILAMSPEPSNLACRGARRSAWVDQIAKAIAHEFGEVIKP